MSTERDPRRPGGRTTNRQRNAAGQAPRRSIAPWGEGAEPQGCRENVEAVVTREDQELDIHAGVGANAGNGWTSRWGRTRSETGSGASRRGASGHPVPTRQKHHSSTPLLVAFLGRGVGETDALFRKAMRVELGRNPGQVPRGHENRSEESRVAFLIAGRILTQARQL